jgi:hypothetical protein
MRMRSYKVPQWRRAGAGDFDGTLRRVLAFLKLLYDPGCERFHELDRRDERSAAPR